MAPLKNWDNKTWLSSHKYINSFNRFILKQVKLNKNSRILDIGCGRGKILENLSNKLRLLSKPVGLDIENHKDKSKKIIFKKIDALTFISKTKITYDLILIKQTIHLLERKQIIKLLSICKNQLFNFCDSPPNFRKLACQYLLIFSQSTKVNLSHFSKKSINCYFYAV